MPSRTPRLRGPPKPNNEDGRPARRLESGRHDLAAVYCRYRNVTCISLSTCVAFQPTRPCGRALGKGNIHIIDRAISLSCNDSSDQCFKIESSHFLVLVFTLLDRRHQPTTAS